MTPGRILKSAVKLYPDQFSHKCPGDGRLCPLILAWVMVGVDLKVVDSEGKEVPRDGKTVGEIIARGDNVMKGYWKLPEETEIAIVGGYFGTGDLATAMPKITS
jgi:acyl-CoA synthetase (AMP-forming)/AMP-acid ligase II